MLEKLCGPAILYIGFSVTQIILDIFQKMYNTAFLKFMVMIILVNLAQVVMVMKLKSVIHVSGEALLIVRSVMETVR